MATRSKPTKAHHVQQAIMYPLDWVEERSGLIGGVKYFLFRKVRVTSTGSRRSGRRR